MIQQQFKERLLMSLISVASLFFAIFYAHHSFFQPFFVLATMLLSIAALQEFYSLAIFKNQRPFTSLAIIGSLFYILNSYLALNTPSFAGTGSLWLLFLLVALFLASFKQIEGAIGIIYITVPLTSILQITYFSPHGRLWLAYLLVATKMTDVGAYITGKLIGKRPLAPQISPQKTIEGAIGGLLASLGATVLFYNHFFLVEQLMTFWQSIFIGLMINLLAQAGDLAESLLKRDAKVKDSSHLPGFGGILDMVDSLLFTLPFFYLLLSMKWIG